jgi:hypothetical protein
MVGCRLSLQFHPENGVRILIRNVVNHMYDYVVSLSTRLEFELLKVFGAPISSLGVTGQVGSAV